MFDTNYKLYNHRYAVHNLQDCRCEFCGGTYKNKKLLQVHKRVSHPDLYEAAKNAKQLQEIQEYAASMASKVEPLQLKPQLPQPAALQNDADQSQPIPAALQNDADTSQPSPSPQPLQLANPVPLYPQY